jgi:hypothetical protein
VKIKKLGQLFGLSVILMIVIIGVIGCQSGTTKSTTFSESTIRAWADPETETTLQGMFEGNLAKYIQYAAPDIKAAATQEGLDEAVKKNNDYFGTYISVEFVSIGPPGEAFSSEQTIVDYKVTFSKGARGVEVIFNKDHQIQSMNLETLFLTETTTAP